MNHRIAIIGIGSAGSRHLVLAREKFPQATIMVLRKNKEVAVPDFADGTFASFTEVTDFEPTIAVVASPAPLHAEALTELLPLGTNVLVEKPLAASEKDARSLLKLDKASGGICLVGYNLRFTESIGLFREKLSAGSIGVPLAFRSEVGQWLPDWRSHCDYRATVSAQSSLGGGVLLELSHEFDYLGWLFGEPEWVMAHTSRQSALEIDVEDSSQILFGGELHSDSRQLTGSLAMDLFRRDKTRYCNVIGEEGTLCWDGVRGTVKIFDRATGEWRKLMHRPDDVSSSYRRQWEHFVKCIYGEETPLITMKDAYRSLVLIDACRTSSNEGRKVYIAAGHHVLPGAP